ncbi:DUF397 domain-containing protein [Streptomyces hoynatensis]|uniref:DUF397 domain-containing protein n=1 Tax=Streptomyces hoynatensis TaxID=1141874 RepID=A0A3A9ZAD3_9ACTN|nr:DUF397 domain-containing protein [Streptomyces hoynatensis]RKN45019.1 DUF397 domain-containing protein [Streptomyces hoynatensis]
MSTQVPTWIRSSYSSSSGGECVECRLPSGDVVPVRDSKVSQGATLRLSAGSWSAFVDALKRGELPG